MRHGELGGGKGDRAVTDESAGRTGLDALMAQYTSALRLYIAGGGTAALARAREIGLRALRERLSVGNLATLATEVLADLLRVTRRPDESTAVVKAAVEFFAAALTPLELTQESYRQATRTLRDMIVTLEEELRRHERELREGNERLVQLLNLASDAVITMDNEGRITRFNHGAEALFGCRADAALGKPLDTLLPERFLAAHREHVAAFARAPEAARPMSGRAPVVGRRPDGSEFEASASVAKLPHGEGFEFLVILRATSTKS
jgi:PAS domain S-box-containing protein